MSEILLYYTPVAPTTWAYLSSLLMIGLFFKFNRFWSVRNLDLVLLILLAPGLLLENYSREVETLEQRAGASISSAAHGTTSSTAVSSANHSTATMPPASQSGASETNGPAAAPPDTPAVADSARELASRSPADASPIVPPPREQATGESARLAPPDTATSARMILSGNPHPAVGSRSLRLLAYIWLFSVSGVFLIRMLLDPNMVRRPLLEPNLSPGGLTFIGCSLFVFLMANVITRNPTEQDLAGPRRAAQLLQAQAAVPDRGQFDELGPGNAFLHVLPTIPTMPRQSDSASNRNSEVAYISAAKTMAIVSHLAVVLGIAIIGYRHFSNIKMGIGAATLYLMLPYTAQMTGRVPHVLPAALLVWAILCYRRPLTAGMFIGMAVGVMYYPLFLLPLWISFYWQRGLMRFLAGVLSMIAFNALLLLFVSSDASEYVDHLRSMLGLWPPRMQGFTGMWGLGWEPVYRIPVITGFMVLSLSLAIWPIRKNLGTLISCSAGVMIAAQFWHGNGGGLYMAWYLPMVLLTIFRPNLEDRVALTVLGESWLERRRRTLRPVDRAA